MRQGAARRGPATPQAMMRALADLSPAQQALLREIARHPRPVTVAELSEWMDRHPNSVREAMAVLVETRLVTRTARPSHGRGRPSWTYQSVAPVQAETLTRELADVCAAVAEHLETGTPDPAAAARDIGARWGRRMLDLVVDPVPGSRDQPVEVQAGRIRLFLSSLGYEALADDDPTRILLFQCPLLGDGQGPGPIVCEMHRGMLTEVVGAVSGGTIGVHLEPLAGPGHCAVELRVR